MVDAIGLGPIDRKVLGVRVPSSALNFMKPTAEKQQDGTIKLTIYIPWDTIQKIREEVVTNTIKNMTLPGFRKGMAPRKVAEKSIDQLQLQEEILRQALPKAYSDAVTEEKLQPIMSPKIHVDKIEEGKDWQFTAETCEMPEVKLGDYKDAVKKITAKSKIIVPGKEEKKEPNMDELVKAVLSTSTVTIPEILIDSEADRLLSQLLDEVKSLGLSLDQYLASTHKDREQVRQEYKERAKQDITFEFVLQKIAEDGKITVEKNELEEALSRAQSPEERKNLEANIYLLASILRQQKTLDYLKSL